MDSRKVGLWTLALMGLSLSVSSARGEITVSDISLKSNDEDVKAYLAFPEGTDPFPAVVVVSEWWGLTDWIKDNAKRLAAKGYVAIAPDLYRGKATDDPTIARQLRMGLPQDRAVGDLKAAVAFLAEHKDVDKDKIGCVGWCMGGQYSLLLALSEPRIKACVICYGALITNADELKPLNATVLGIFGETDAGIPPKMVSEFEAALKSAGKTVAELKIYPETGHAFMRPTVGATAKNPTFNERHAADAFGKIDAFFAETLGGRP